MKFRVGQMARLKACDDINKKYHGKWVRIDEVFSKKCNVTIEDPSMMDRSSGTVDIASLEHALNRNGANSN